jgi:phosphoribosylformylglycinamidine synthase
VAVARRGTRQRRAVEDFFVRPAHTPNQNSDSDFRQAAICRPDRRGKLFGSLPTQIFAKLSVARMKAKIIITPKKAVLDPQGKTVQTALEHMGYTGVTGVHIGKYIEIDLVPGTDKVAATKALNDAAHKLLSNPVIEDYKLEVE